MARTPEGSTFKTDIVLGEVYRDNTTGKTGTAVSIHFYLHACERVSLRYLDGDVNVQEATFDAPELTHVVSGVTATAEKTGGPERGNGARAVPSR